MFKQFLNWFIHLKNKYVHSLSIENSKYKMLLYEASDAIYLVNSKGIITFANPSAHILFGYSEQELVGKNIDSLIQLSSESVTPFAANLIAEKGIVAQQEFIRKDTSIFKGEMSARLFDDGSHQAVIRDITKGLEQQKQLLDRERTFKTLVENSFDIIIVLKSDFTIKFVSPVVKKMLGYEVDEVIGQKSNRFIEFRDRVTIKELLKNPGITYAINDLKLIHKNSQIIHCEVNAVNFIKDPLIEGIIVNCHDISNRVETENQLKNTNFELDSFVYKVSHDLKAPLRSILGLINLSKSENKDPTINLYLDMMLRSIQSLDSFIKDLTQFSRNSRMETVSELIDFDKIISETINNLKYQENAGAITVIKEINNYIPFYSDPHRVSTIIGNLLSNAYKYHRFNGNNPYINIKIDTSESIVKIVISDNGTGIPVEYHEKIFNMFFRASEKSQGSGLGLYIVKSALDKIHGKVFLESTLDIGSTFTIEIPNLLIKQ
jgi:PAS domain S-box-containing protein